MDIRVSGHQIETGEALQAHAQERLTGVVLKYFNRALSSGVTFSKAPASTLPSPRWMSGARLPE